MAEGRYSTLLEKMKKAYIGTGSGMDKLKAGWKWENGQYVKVWSGATVVSYYDGDTLMGTEEVDEGEDVLHPSFSTSKDGYTLYGWGLNSDERITSLVASGETMTLYAIYTANTKTMSNVCALSAHAVYNEQFRDGTFTVNMGRYQSGTITAYASFSDEGTGAYLIVGAASLDGVEFVRPTAGGSGSRAISATEGTHSLHLYVKSYDNYGQDGSVSASILLTNPIAWE